MKQSIKNRLETLEQSDHAGIDWSRIHIDVLNELETYDPEVWEQVFREREVVVLKNKVTGEFQGVYALLDEDIPSDADLAFL